MFMSSNQIVVSCSLKITQSWIGRVPWEFTGGETTTGEGLTGTDTSLDFKKCFFGAFKDFGCFLGVKTPFDGLCPPEKVPKIAPPSHRVLRIKMPEFNFKTV